MNAYEEESGQQVNYQKSSIYFGKAKGYVPKYEISRILSMSRGSLPFKYLGVPLFRGKPRKHHLQGLMDSLVDKLSGWNGAMLSMAGRLALVKYSIAGALTHSFSVYQWPISLLHSLENMVRNFVWSGCVSRRKLISVAWRKICRPLDEGGLGFRSFKITNKALLLKLAWQIMEGKNSLLHVLRDRFINKYGEVRSTGVISSIWVSIKAYYSSLLAETLWIIGEHSVVKFWNSNWLGFVIASRVDKQMDVNWDAMISDYYTNGSWQLPAILENSYGDIVNEVKKVEIMPGHIDKLIWKNNFHGEVTSRTAFDALRDHVPKVLWGKWIWAPYIPPRRSLLVWRTVHNALPTFDNIRLRGIPLASACPFCLRSSENIDHLFTGCAIPQRVWRHYFDILNLNLDLQGGFNALLVQVMRLQLSPSLKAVVKAIVMAISWSIWEARNKLIFEGRRPYISGLISLIWTSIHELKYFKLSGFYGNQKELQIAMFFQLPCSFKQRMRVKEVHWVPPLPGWVKVNVDGSAKGAPGGIVSAGVFRTCRGFVKGCFVADMGVGYALEAEIWAVIIAIEVAFHKGWRRLWLESDSLLVVKLLRRKIKVVPWRILPRWLHCLHLIGNMEVGISHIYREGNQPADHLTSISGSSFRWWSSCPSFLWSFVSRDLQERPYFRFY